MICCRHGYTQFANNAGSMAFYFIIIKSIIMGTIPQPLKENSLTLSLIFL
jgi:hypothetical protein